MSNLDKLKRYLENSISKIKEENKKIELQKRYKQIADTIIEQLNNGEYLAINISGLAELFDFIYNTTTSNELKKFEEAVQLSEFFEMEEIVQITKAKEYLEELKESLKKYSSSFEMSIYKARRHLSGNLKKYEEYLSLFNDNGIQVHLDGPELNEFFEFLKNSSLEKQLVYELIVEFSKDSIEYYTGLKKLKTKKEASIVTKNSKRVAQTIKKSIVRPTVVETKLETPTETVYYTEAEKEIIGKIKEIIETLERDNNQSVDYALSELLIGDYELSTREKIFS